MSSYGFAAVGIGAALGAWLRWGLGLWLNALNPAVPPGTLAANLIGGYLIGIAVGGFAATSSLAPEWRLLIITGFLGGLTTFSTFSAESVALLQQARYAAVLLHSCLHLIGSVLATLAGFATWRALSA
jgi:fluoride exporter